MKNPSEGEWDDLRLKVLGLGESSVHRAQPSVRQRLTELEHFRALTDLAGDLLLAIELPSGRILEVNETTCSQVGKCRDELLDQTFQDVFGTAALEPLLKPRGTKTQARLVVTADLTIGSRQVTAEIVASIIPLRTRSRAVLAMRDITDRLRAEAELRETIANLAQASRLAQLGAWSCDPRDGTMQWSGELCRILGTTESGKSRSPEELLSFVVASDRERVRRALATAIQLRSALNIEFRFVRQNETSERFAHASAEVVRQGKETPHLLGVLQDVTDRKRLEQQFQQAQKLESIGRLAGGVAHDFNNLLTVIAGYNELAASSLPPDDPLQAYLSEIQHAGERARGLTQQLLTFSRRQAVEPKPVNVNELVAETEKMLRRLIGEDIELITQLAPSVDLVLADPGQITQVLMNLVVNARDAMPNGGRLIIETASTEVGPESLDQYPDAQPGKYVQLGVIDNGVGMSKEIQSHIFEPFFTTKGHGAGTGLGLATVYGIVRQSNGWVSVESEPGLGSKFTVHLPGTGQQHGTAPAEMSRSNSTIRGTETILVVEDQVEVRKLIADGLRTYGYHVLEAASGDEALQLCGRRDCRIDLVVTDMVMPGLTGHQVAEQLSSLDCDVTVLYMSGYTEHVTSREDLAESGINYIAKPFTPAGLAARIRQLLASRK